MGSEYDSYFPGPLPPACCWDKGSSGARARCPQDTQTLAKACLGVFIDQHIHTRKHWEREQRALPGNMFSLSVIDFWGGYPDTGKAASLPCCRPSMEEEFFGKLRPDTSHSPLPPHCPLGTCSGSLALSCYYYLLLFLPGLFTFLPTQMLGSPPLTGCASLFLPAIQGCCSGLVLLQRLTPFPLGTSFKIPFLPSYHGHVTCFFFVPKAPPI